MTVFDDLEPKGVMAKVKVGKTGRLWSLQQFMCDKRIPLGVGVSQRTLSLEDGILSVPLYLLQHLSRGIESIKPESQ